LADLLGQRGGIDLLHPQIPSSSLDLANAIQDLLANISLAMLSLLRDLAQVASAGREGVSHKTILVPVRVDLWLFAGLIK
jgi:hypothetical protein